MPTPLPHITTFRDSMPALAAGMRWWGKEWGQKWLYLDGLLFDGLWERMRLGVRASFPGDVTDESLPYIGDQRAIIRGETEPNDVYARRLTSWLDAWRTAGHALGMLRQIQASLYPVSPLLRVVSTTVDIRDGVPITNWWTLDADGVGSYVQQKPGLWNWDGQSADQWSRFWVIVGPGKWTATGAVWGGFDWGDGTLWGGSNITSAELRSLRRIIQQWKGAHTQCGATSIGGGIILVSDNNLFAPTATTGLPDGTWGNPVNRNPAALYLNGF